VFLGKKRYLLRGRAAIPGEKIDGLLPGCLLPTVEFPQIKNVALENPTTGHSAIFDNAPVKMLFTVLKALFASQKHDLSMKAVHPANAQAGRSALQALLETTPCIDAARRASESGK
jgi:hypothetical protein